MDKKLVVLKNNERPASSKARRLRDLAPDHPIEITLELRGPALPEPGNKPLSKAAFEKKFGAKPADAAKVSKVLAGFGLRTDEVCLATRSLRISGSSEQIEAAFKPGLGIYEYSTKGRGEFRGRQGDLHVPAALDKIVLGVFGLDERRVTRRDDEGPIAARAANEPAVRYRPHRPLTAADIEKRYNFPEGDGAGQHIAIAEFGGAFLLADLKAYCDRQKRRMPRITNVYDGLEPDFSKADIDSGSINQEGFAMESMMDIEIIAGLCPRSNITVYWATQSQKGWTDMLMSVFKAEPLPVALSISWGRSEDKGDFSPAAVTAINLRLKALAHLGVTVCVASGDNGSSGGVFDDDAHVQFPASSPYVLAVGGTMLKGTNEAAWWVKPGRQGTGSGGGASGGGVSKLFDRPHWQQELQIDSVNKGTKRGRIVPDVAALAGSPEYETVVENEAKACGGTSGAAPLWAALIARVNAKLPRGKQQRFLTPLLYQKIDGEPRGSLVCRDISDGTNNTSSPLPDKGYTVGSGYDAVTGWGAPDGMALLKSL